MINLIKFKKEYYNNIITGTKTQTLRLARKRLDVQEGEICKAIFPGTKLECKIQITEIGYKQFKSINQEDAKLEGYNTIEELKNTLKEIYPLIDEWDRLYYYRFKLIQ